MAGKVGFRINTEMQRPDQEILDAIGALETPAISDGMCNFNAVDPKIRPIDPALKVVGPAVTLRVRPGDNLMLHKALGVARPGDVLVIDTCGCDRYAMLGELIATAAFEAAKLGGIVVDGGVRDVTEMRAKRFPVFAKFFSPCVGDKDGPGEINYPVCLGGVAVHPGDIIVGDVNGVVVVPRADAAAVIENAKKKLAYEEKRRQSISAGVIVKPEIDETLKKKGVIE